MARNSLKPFKQISAPVLELLLVLVIVPALAFVSFPTLQVALVLAEDSAPTLVPEKNTLPLEQIEKDAVLLTDKSEPVLDQRYTLNSCLDLALQQSFEIRDARARIERQRGVKLEVRSILLPKLGLKSGYEQLDKNRLSAFNGNSFGSDSSWSADAEITQPLYTGGRGSALNARERLLLEAAEFDFLSVVNSVTLAVKERFFNALLARARVDVNEASVNLLEEVLSSERDRLTAGTVSDFDVLRAEVELANAKTPLIQARNELRLSLEDLIRVIGIPQEEADKVRPAIRLQGSLVFENAEFTLAEALRLASLHRPELKQLRKIEEAQRFSIRAASAGYYPSLGLRGGYGIHSSRFADDLSETDEGWIFGADAQWSLFDGMNTSGKVAQAEAEHTLAENAQARTKLDIDVEVRRTLSALLEARELVVASTKVVEQADESLRLARARLEAGSARQLDVLDTQVAVTEARTNHIQSLHAYNVALARVERALGLSVR